MNKRHNRSWLAPVLFLCLLSSMIILLTDSLTRDKIDANRNAALLDMLVSVSSGPFDNDLLHDYTGMTLPAYYGAENSMRVYYTRLDGEITGLIFIPVHARGYNDLIELIVGISSGGRITGVKVLAEAETEGLGDNIHQDRSGWLGQFNSASFDQVTAARWALKKDNGVYDQVTGATVTSRAVIQAVKHILDYHEYNRQELYQSGSL